MRLVIYNKPSGQTKKLTKQVKKSKNMDVCHFYPMFCEYYMNLFYFKAIQGADYGLHASLYPNRAF